VLKSRFTNRQAAAVGRQAINQQRNTVKRLCQSATVAAAVVVGAWTTPAGALTLSPNNGLLGINPQQEAFSASGVARLTTNPDPGEYIFQDSFYFTVVGNGNQNLDITLTAASADIPLLDGGLHMSLGETSPVTQGILPPINIESFGLLWGGFTNLITAGDYVITFAGFADSPLVSYAGTVTAGAPQATPLPAALPLFATSLGVMGFLAKRRKRKNTAVVAA
jgi:hypothetical protein